MCVFRKAPLLALFLLLGACRSDPVHYHTLTPLLSANPSVPQPANDVQIERVTVPPQVDRSQIVVRQSRNELIVMETDWWGASLVDEVQSALSAQLNMRPGSGRKATLRVELQRFDLVPGQYALIDAKWRIRSGQLGSENASELSCQTLLQTRSGPTVEDLVVAQQQNLQQLASTISDASRSRAGRCP
jgi:uncharacterized lipoprotein YmbA